MRKLLVGIAVVIGIAFLVRGFLPGLDDVDTGRRPSPFSENALMADGNTKVVRTEAEWRELLSDEEFRILREAGTEARGTGEYDHVFTPGTYICRGCGFPLFASDAKFDSGCGWPAFFKPLEGFHITEIEDVSYGMRRVEVRCSRCDGHLGHVFPDAPQTPTGMRYCINSASIQLIEDVLRDPHGGNPVPEEPSGSK